MLIYAKYMGTCHMVIIYFTIIIIITVIVIFIYDLVFCNKDLCYFYLPSPSP